MRRVLDCAKKDLVRALRAPSALLVWLGIPLGIGLLMNLAFSGGSGGTPRVQLLLVDESESLIGDLVAGAGGDRSGGLFEIERTTLEAGRARLEAGEASAMLVLPEGLGAAILTAEPATLRLVTNPAQRVLPGIAEEVLGAATDLVFYAQRLIGDRLRELGHGPPDGSAVFPDATIADFAVEVNRLAERAEATFFPPLVDLAERATPALESAPRPDLFELMFPGLLLMALAFMASGLSIDLWRERDAGTLARHGVLPGGVLALMLGKTLAGGALMAAVCVLASAIGVAAYDLGASELLLCASFTPLAGMVFLQGFFLLNLWSSSQNAANLIASLILFPALMAGGSFFPFEALPDWLADVGRATPNGWVLVHLRAVAFEGEPVTALVLPVLVLVAVGVLLTALVLRRLPRFLGT